MKLKYYMRGLGIGILITTIVLSLGNKKERLSDEQVMARARELGMIMQESSDNKLEEVLENITVKNDKDIHDTNKAQNDTDDPKHSEVTNEEVPVYNDVDSEVEITDPSDEESYVDTDLAVTEPSDEDIDEDITETLDEDIEAEEIETSDEDIDEDITETSDENIEAEEIETSDENIDADITFTIVRGMSSGQVSELVMQKGLIENAIDFDNYIKQKGKASVIRIGTYTLPKDASYKEILEAITG